MVALGPRAVLRPLVPAVQVAEVAARLVIQNPEAVRAALVVRQERAVRLVRGLRVMTARLARRFKAELVV